MNIDNRDWRHFALVEIRFADGRNPRVFASLEEAVGGVAYHLIRSCKRGHIGSTLFGEVNPASGDPVEFRDECGLLIPLWRVQEAARQTKADEIVFRWPRIGRFVFRDGPVEGIRRRRWRKGGGYRRMRTTQETRENDFLNHYDEEAAEYGVKARHRRMDLPNAWDDFYPHSVRNHNWKRFRHTQWRE